MFFDKGLSIAHYGYIVVHPNARIGENCRIQEAITIGAANGSSQSARIGNNCFLVSGAKIIDDITIVDDVAIGANSVVVKNILKPVTTWGGGLQKNGNNSSRLNLNHDSFFD